MSDVVGSLLTHVCDFCELLKVMLLTIKISNLKIKLFKIND